MFKENFYLFLDIDGVLYDMQWIKKEYDAGNILVKNLHTFKPESIFALNLLINKLEEKYNVDLVICSTWRNNMENTVNTLYENGLKKFKNIHCTKGSLNPANRAEEILDYLYEKADNQNFVIIDDESFDCQKHFSKNKIIKPNIYSDSLSTEMVHKYLANIQTYKFGKE